MTLEELISLIGTQGFAIAISIFCLWQNYKSQERMIGVIEKNTSAYEKLASEIQALGGDKKPGD